MGIITNPARPLTDLLMFSLLTTIRGVFGCGVMPAGQSSSRPFTVSGFTTLPVEMVFDVLERQGRSALLPDFAISSILNQLEVRIAYEPLQCQRIVLDITMELKPEPAMMGDQYCIITGNTVTGICTALMTTNIIMATWPRMTWQNVMDRAVRILASRPFGSHFIAATGTIGGN
ncbi:hypothetical protein KIN20_010900 [Parelaphostrongylus tenuis]|uniref:Secreted protein n=1 Tax=Parelaphostrongylus tenuis TaxID=148309 RepID=A0AAD5QM45_PARTN|nr:hypothetical protein KIN20_010900 [Parelaphostrongylus tenuis]